MHIQDLLLFVLVGPLSLCLAALVAAVEGRRGVTSATLAKRAARYATTITFIVAALAAGLFFIHGAQSSSLLGRWGLGLSIRLDAVSAITALLIAFIGIVVTRYSENYLAGDPRQATFIGRLCLTLSAVVTLVLSGNLAQLAIAWVATSLSLHQLLVFYPNRERAQVAAKKKFWSARAGDMCLVGAFLLLASELGSPDIATLNATVRNASAAAAGGTIQVAATLLAAAAMLKSAQFPTHGWLVEVMETPTPVSALLHAGIVNAGGFLALRFADVLLASPAAMALLASIGAATALFGSAAMLTQPAVKTQLAYSTVAQMGFMLFECGIGAFGMALLHLVAHSAYKAHAFLSAGRAVELAHPLAALPLASSLRARTSRRMQSALPIALAVLGIALVLALPERAAVLTLATIVATGATMLFARMLTAVASLRAFAAAVGVMLLYLLLEQGVLWLTAQTLPPPVPASGFVTGVMVVALGAFGALAALQPMLDGDGHPPWLRAGYVHLRQGLYANAVFDRFARPRAQVTATPSAIHAHDTHAQENRA